MLPVYEKHNDRIGTRIIGNYAIFVGCSNAYTTLINAEGNNKKKGENRIMMAYLSLYDKHCEIHSERYKNKWGNNGNKNKNRAIN